MNSAKRLDIDPAHVEWSLETFHRLDPRSGKWIVPRSDLVFRRYGDVLVLQPNDLSELTRDQLVEFTGIKLYFNLAGVDVRP